MKYLIVIESKGYESEKSTKTLAEAWRWLNERFPPFADYFENEHKFQYWYGRRKTIGIAAEFVKACRCIDYKTGNETFRFRVELVLHTAAG